MSRLKLILLALIVIVLGIVFVQNREPLALKLLCPQVNQTCLYQTQELPLAIWMTLFAVGGIVTSLLSQVLNRYAYGSKGRKRSNYSDFEEDKDKWSGRDSQSDRYSGSSSKVDDFSSQDKYTAGSYEAPQKPETVERSGSTYSYKYRDVSDRHDEAVSNSVNKNEKSQNIAQDSNIDLNKDDEDWI